ncbi:type II toxin-antitoxin system VapC family toxin [Amycolatopsis sp. lyj-112]|uniref:type II toxin-antitoxin system VapC family toxin n=1 Tax=Amycolatopsis sp. lyj-112 TaxID=2789288 RepID=UPI003979EC9D
MTKQLPRIAVDTCIVLDLITGVDEKRQADARWLFAHHGDKHTIVMPAIVLAEVGGAGCIRGDHGGKDARQARVDKAMAWVRDSGYQVAELSERLARHAAQLAVDHNLKGADATILATALAWDCHSVCTRDHDLLKLDDVVAGLKIAPPQPDLDAEHLFSVDNLDVTPNL